MELILTNCPKQAVQIKNYYNLNLLKYLQLQMQLPDFEINTTNFANQVQNWGTGLYNGGLWVHISLIGIVFSQPFIFFRQPIDLLLKLLCREYNECQQTNKTKSTRSFKKINLFSHISKKNLWSDYANFEKNQLSKYIFFLRILPDYFSASIFALPQRVLWHWKFQQIQSSFLEHGEPLQER